jgi:hypothetical protein
MAGAGSLSGFAGVCPEVLTSALAEVLVEIQFEVTSYLAMFRSAVAVFEPLTHLGWYFKSVPLSTDSVALTDGTDVPPLSQGTISFTPGIPFGESGLVHTSLLCRSLAIWDYGFTVPQGRPIEGPPVYTLKSSRIYDLAVTEICPGADDVVRWI